VADIAMHVLEAIEQGDRQAEQAAAERRSAIEG